MKKKSLRIILSFLLLSTTISYGQNKYAEIITSEGTKMIKALKAKKYETLLQYTYPKLVELSGGETKLINDISIQMKKMENDGVTISNVKIGKPKNIFNAGTELHCLVPQELTLAVPNGKVITNSFLLAVSMDDGKNWDFVDTSQLNTQKVKELFPEFNFNLKLPEKNSPKFIPN